MKKSSLLTIKNIIVVQKLRSVVESYIRKTLRNTEHETRHITTRQKIGILKSIVAENTRFLLRNIESLLLVVFVTFVSHPNLLRIKHFQSTTTTRLERLGAFYATIVIRQLDMCMTMSKLSIRLRNI